MHGWGTFFTFLAGLHSLCFVCLELNLKPLLQPSGHFRGCWFIFLPLHAASSLKCLLEGDSDFQSQSGKDPGFFSGCEVLRSPCACLWLVVGAPENSGVSSEINFEIKHFITFL